MSRSAQQGFTEWITKMREEHNVIPTMTGGLDTDAEVIVLHKQSARITLPDAVLFEMMAETDSRYEQRATKTIVAATSEDWAKYHLAKRALLTLQAYENTTGAEEVQIPCPKPKTHYTFLETIDEWLARCRTLRTEQAA